MAIDIPRHSQIQQQALIRPHGPRHIRSSHGTPPDIMLTGRLRRRTLIFGIQTPIYIKTGSLVSCRIARQRPRIMPPGVTATKDASKAAHITDPERAPLRVSQKEADDTTYFFNTNKDSVSPLTPDAESKLIRKNFCFLLGQTWWISFLIHLDRATLSSASTMGIFKDIHMSKNEYNELFILFYVGYLIALWPGAWLSQRLGHKQFITGSLFLWAVLIGVHPAVKTGRQMMAVRFLLGMVSRIPDPTDYVRTLTWTPDRIASGALNSHPPPSLFPSEKEPLGPTAVVDCRQSGQCASHHDGLQAYQGR